MRLKLLLATGLGVGYFPVAPGTVGSLLGLLLVWALTQSGGTLAAAVGWVLVTAAGFWAAGAGEQHFGRTDRSNRQFFRRTSRCFYFRRGSPRFR